jgi:hypothetical protein
MVELGLPKKICGELITFYTQWKKKSSGVNRTMLKPAAIVNRAMNLGQNGYENDHFRVLNFCKSCCCFVLSMTFFVMLKTKGAC